jgi:hypothetical protein
VGHDVVEQRQAVIAGNPNDPVDAQFGQPADY